MIFEVESETNDKYMNIHTLNFKIYDIYRWIKGESFLTVAIIILKCKSVKINDSHLFICEYSSIKTLTILNTFLKWREKIICLFKIILILMIIIYNLYIE